MMSFLGGGKQLDDLLQRGTDLRMLLPPGNRHIRKPHACGLVFRDAHRHARFRIICEVELGAVPQNSLAFLALAEQDEESTGRRASGAPGDLEIEISPR